MSCHYYEPLCPIYHIGSKLLGFLHLCGHTLLPYLNWKMGEVGRVHHHNQEHVFHVENLGETSLWFKNPCPIFLQFVSFSSIEGRYLVLHHKVTS